MTDRLSLAKDAISKLSNNTVITPSNDRLGNEPYRVSPNVKAPRSVGNIDFYTGSQPSKMFENADTDVSAYSRYGVNITRFNNYNLDRAKAQTRTEQALNTAKRMGTTIAGQAVSGVGAIGAIIENITKESSRGTADFNNALMEWGDTIEQFGTNKAPIYRENPGKSWDVNDFAWWAENSVNVASSIGLMIPGVAAGSIVGKTLSTVGKLSRVSNIAGKGTKFTKALGRMLASGTGKGNYYGNLITSSFVMRNGENMKESLQTVNQIREEALSMPDDEYIKLISDPNVLADFKSATNKPLNKENFADYIAARAGWRTYALDASNVVFDMMQIAPMLRGISPNTRSLLSNSKIKNTNLVTAGKKQLTKTESFLNNIAYIGAGVGAREVLTEGIEESVNFMAQEEGLYYGKALLNKVKEGKTPKERLNSYLNDPQMWEQAFWGAIGGGVFAGVTRAYRDVKNIAFDVKDAKSTKERISEIGGRLAKVQELFNDIKLTDSGVNPNIKDKDGNYKPIQSEDELNSINQRLINKIGSGMGLSASKASNMNLLEDHLRSTEYRNKLKEINPDIDVDTVLDNILDRALKVEELYNNFYTNIYSRDDIPDNIKGVLVTELINDELDITDHLKKVSDASSLVNERLGTKLYSNLSDAIAKATNNKSSLHGSIQKSALQILKGNIKSAIKLLEGYGAESTINNYNKVLDKIESELSNLNNELGYNKITEFGVEESIIQNKSSELGHQYTADILSEEVGNKIANLSTYANEQQKGVDEIANAVYDSISNTFEDDLSKADTSEKVNKLINKLKYAQIDAAYSPKILDKINSLTRKANKKYKSLLKHETRKKNEGKVEVEPKTEPRRDIKPEDNDIVTEVKETEEIVPDKDVTDTIEGNKEATDITIQPKSEGETDSFFTGTGEVTTDDKNITGEDGIKPVETETGTTEETSDTEEDAEPSKEKDKTIDTDDSLNKKNENEDLSDLFYESPLYDIALFISSAYNMNFKNRVNDDNIITLNEKETELFLSIIRDIKVGSKLTIKYDPDYNRPNTLSKPLAVYYGDKKLFHLSEVHIKDSVGYFDHKGIRYTLGSNWTNYVITQLRSDMFNEQLSLLFQYRINTINGVNNDEILSKLKDLDILEIININRTGNDIIKESDDLYYSSIDHISKVLTYGVNIFNTLPSNENILNNLVKWQNRIVSDLNNTIKTRKYFLENANLELETSVSSKTPGSFVKGLNTTINNVAGNTTDDFNIPLLIKQLNNPFAVSTANGIEVNGKQLKGSIDEKASGHLVYIPMVVGNIEGDGVNYKYVAADYSDLSQEDVPDSVSEYNKQIVDYIIKSISESTNLNDLLAKIKPYVQASIVSFTNKETGVVDKFIEVITSEQVKSGKRVVRIREHEDGLKAYRHYAKKPTKESSLKYLFAHSRRTVMFDKSKTITDIEFSIPTGEFVDFNGEIYNSYTEFVIKTGAIISNYGSVRDNNGKLISNVEVFSTSNSLGQDMRILTTSSVKTKVQESEPGKEEMSAKDNNNTSLLDFANTINNKQPYTSLFTLIDKLGIRIESDKRYPNEGDSINAFASFTFDKDNKGIIRLYSKFDKLKNTDSKIRQLAHESIHGITQGNVTEQNLRDINTVFNKFKEKYRSEEFQNEINDRIRKHLDTFIEEVEKNPIELITYGLSDSIVAMALNKFEGVLNKQPGGLARELLDIILEVINRVFGNTLLTDVSSILEDIITKPSTPITTTPTNPINIIDSINNSEQILNEMDEMYSVIGELSTQLPSALDYIKSLNSQDRAIVREAINNQSLIFKCI